MLKPLLGTKHFSEMDILDKLIEHQPRIYQILDKQFSVEIDNQELLKRHKEIAKITSKIITTNYDKALEVANNHLGKIAYNNTYRVTNIYSTDRYIYKLHGCIEDPTTGILFSKDYENLYENSSNKSAIEELRKIIGDNTIV